MQKNRLELAFSDLFIEETARRSTCIELARYVSFACENQDNYKSDDNTAAEVKENNDEDMERGFSDNVYELYGMYDQYALWF